VPAPRRPTPWIYLTGGLCPPPLDGQSPSSLPLTARFPRELVHNPAGSLVHPVNACREAPHSFWTSAIRASSVPTRITAKPMNMRMIAAM